MVLCGKKTVEQSNFYSNREKKRASKSYIWNHKEICLLGNEQANKQTN